MHRQQDILNRTYVLDARLYPMLLAERNSHGSSRVGQEQFENFAMTGAPFYSGNANFSISTVRGDKSYELSNHLATLLPSAVGNVLAVVSDRKLPVGNTATHKVSYFTADVIQFSDYYPFGMTMPGRHSTGGDYRYGFNGMEADDEIKNEGNSYDFGARMYDSRVGRWFSIDPLPAKYPTLSPYHFTANNPILFQDFDGRDFIVKNTGDQDKVRASLSLAFNGASDAFTYDKRGKLTIDISKIHGELTSDQSFLLSKVQEIATDSELKVSIANVSEGGNYTDPKAFDRSTGKVTKADILINISHPKVNSKMKDTEDGTLKSDDPNFELTEEQIWADILFHEIGHVSEDKAGNLMYGTEEQAKKNDRKTVGIENVFRRIIGVNERAGNLHGDNDGDDIYENKGKEEPSPVKQE